MSILIIILAVEFYFAKPIVDVKQGLGVCILTQANSTLGVPEETPEGFSKAMPRGIPQGISEQFLEEFLNEFQEEFLKKSNEEGLDAFLQYFQAILEIIFE